MIQNSILRLSFLEPSRFHSLLSHLLFYPELYVPRTYLAIACINQRLDVSEPTARTPRQEFVTGKKKTAPDGIETRNRLGPGGSQGRSRSDRLRLHVSAARCALKLNWGQ